MGIFWSVLCWVDEEDWLVKEVVLFFDVCLVDVLDLLLLEWFFILFGVLVEVVVFDWGVVLWIGFKIGIGEDELIFDIFDCFVFFLLFGGGDSEWGCFIEFDWGYVGWRLSFGVESSMGVFFLNVLVIIMLVIWLGSKKCFIYGKFWVFWYYFIVL